MFNYHLNCVHIGTEAQDFENVAIMQIVGVQ